MTVPFALAHPGEHEKHDASAEMIKREFRKHIRRRLERCAKRFDAKRTQRSCRRPPSKSVRSTPLVEKVDISFQEIPFSQAEYYAINTEKLQRKKRLYGVKFRALWSKTFPCQTILALLVPQGLVKVSALDISQIILLEVHRRVEDKLGSIAAILGPVDLVAGPLAVGVPGEDKGKEVLLHLALDSEENNVS